MFLGLKRRKEKKKIKEEQVLDYRELFAKTNNLKKKTYVKLVSKRMSSFLIRFIIPYNQRDNKR